MLLTTCIFFACSDFFFLVFLFLELLRCAWGNLLNFLFSTNGKLKNHWVNFCFETLLFCFEVFLWGKHEELLKTYSSVSCLLQVFSPSLYWGRMQKLFMSVSKIKDFFNLVFFWNPKGSYQCKEDLQESMLFFSSSIHCVFLSLPFSGFHWRMCMWHCMLPGGEINVETKY